MRKNINLPAVVAMGALSLALGCPRSNTCAQGFEPRDGTCVQPCNTPSECPPSANACLDGYCTPGVAGGSSGGGSSGATGNVSSAASTGSSGGSNSSGRSSSRVNSSTGTPGSSTSGASSGAGSGTSAASSLTSGSSSAGSTSRPLSSSVASSSLGPASSSAGTSSSVMQTSSSLGPQLPILDGVTPNSIPVFSVDTPVTLAGSGFEAGCVVTGPDGPITTVVNSSTQLGTVLPENILETAGTFGLHVDCPAGTSNPLPVEIRPGAARTTWVFPMGTNEGGWYSTIHLFNPTRTPANITLRYLVAPGAMPTRTTATFTAAPRQLNLLDTGNADPGPGTVQFGVELQSSVPVVALMVGRNDGGNGMGLFLKGQDQPFVSGSAMVLGVTGQTLEVMLANPGSTDGTVNLHFTSDAGDTADVAPTVPSGSRAGVAVPANITGNFWLAITAASPIYATTLAGISPIAMLDPEPPAVKRSHWDFLGAPGAGWRAMVYLANSGPNTFNASVHAYAPDNTGLWNLSTELFSGDVDQLYPADNGVELTQPAWITVDAPEPVHAAAALLTSGGDAAGCTLGPSSPARDLVLMGGMEGDNWRTQLFLANPSAVDADVNMAFSLEARAPTLDSVSIPSGRMVLVNAPGVTGDNLLVTAVVNASVPVLGLIQRRRLDNGVLMCASAFVP